MFVLFLLFPSLLLLCLMWLRLRPRPFYDPSITDAAIASSSSSSSSSSTSTPDGGSSRRYPYKVFLSFRGEDTRLNFVSHLHGELTRKGIQAFKDDHDLKRGDSLTPSLLEAISGSRLAVVVLSEHYASSTWCLKELVEIMERKERNEQLVVPVFYKVDPSDVKNQKGSFGEDLKMLEKRRKQEKDYKAEMKRWRNALTQVTTIVGWDSRNRDEAIFIQHVVRDISDKLVCAASLDACDLVAIDSQIAEIDKLLEVKRDVCMLGIWGMGGVGKTTLAKVLYGRMSSQYEACCLIEKVKDKCAVDLQRQLLSEVLGERDLCTGSLDEGSQMIKDRLCCKKVLLVLDDVDDMEQLEVLARNRNWFGLRSTIIITTRDERLLDLHNVDAKYEVKCLQKDDALQLFSRHAFKQNKIEDEYSKLADAFVEYAGGLPLALKVLGCHLQKRPMDFWEEALKQLSRSLGSDIFDVLKVSFDGLKEDEKDVFLDIVCFHNRTSKVEVRSILKDCGLFPDTAFPILVEKSLIRIQEGIIHVHELLLDMGRNIVRHEAAANPGQRSRLWNSKDIHNVLTKKKGTEKIEGIFLNCHLLEVQDKMNLEENAFVGMDHLRFLKVNDFKQRLQLPDGGLQFDTNELVYLNWAGFPLKSLSLRFCAHNLVELHLHCSKLKTLWEGTQDFFNLKVLDLYFSEYLVEIPDLSMAQNIVKINLRLCTSLVEVHSSVQHLYKLEELGLCYCLKLEILPGSLDSYALKRFDLSFCYKVGKCPDITSIEFRNRTFLPQQSNCLDNNNSWGRLDLRFTAITELSSSIEFMSNLVELNMEGCKRFSQLPNCLDNLKSLKSLNLSGTAIAELPSSIGFLSNLTELEMKNCNHLSQLPNCFDNLKSLEKLNLSGTVITELPSSIGFLSNLTELEMQNCKHLSQLPNCFDNLKSLERLNLSGTVITELPLSIGFLSNLTALEMKNCKHLSQLPNCFDNLKSLERLNLSGTVITELPSSIRFLSNLTELEMWNCKHLSQLPNCFDNLTSLERLNLSETAITELPSSIGFLSNLTALEMVNCKHLSQLPNCFDNLTSLKSLNLIGTAITELPSSIGFLSNLSVGLIFTPIWRKTKA